ncbi:MAG: hypothetical protein WBE13_07505 [Candidatus Acidiferrum sp.]
MVKAARAFSSVSADVVLNSLKALGIAFSGPYRTPSGNVLFLVENCLFLETELIEQFKQNKLSREGLQELSQKIHAPGRDGCL